MAVVALFIWFTRWAERCKNDAASTNLHDRDAHRRSRASVKNDNLTLTEARRLALSAQGFGRQRTTGVANWTGISNAIARMRLLQLDSVNVLIRSHYLPVYSRIGPYRRSALDDHAFSESGRALFEYWGHEASLLPFSLQPLLRWRMYDASRHEGLYREIVQFARARRPYIRSVLREVRERGTVTARDLAKPRNTGGWWQWSESKIALEYLFWTGKVSTSSRERFERVYDLTERVIPSDIIALPTPPADEAKRELLLQAARALGIATASDLRDYFRLPAKAAAHGLQALVESGQLRSVKVDGWLQPAYLDPQAKLPRKVTASALLTPFDPLVWERSRTERLFGFHYRLEIYTPEPKRRFGYYVLPLLHNESLVGRVDLKADRKTSRLLALASFCEPGANPGEVATVMAGELRQLADWLELSQVTVGRRGNLATPLRRTLTTGNVYSSN